MNKIVEIIAQELQIKQSQVESTIKLIDEGNTIPFIARYRKEDGAAPRRCRRTVRLRGEHGHADAADRHRAGLLPHEQIRFLAQRERLQHARRSAPAESPAGRHASRARGARLRQQPPPQRGGRQRFLGIGRTASRPRAGGSGAHLPPRTLRNGRTVLLPAAGITRKPPRCAASDRSFGFPAEDGRTALFRQIF